MLNDSLDDLPLAADREADAIRVGSSERILFLGNWLLKRPRDLFFPAPDDSEKLRRPPDGDGVSCALMEKDL